MVLAVEGAMPAVALDRMRLRLLVRNLLDNALRHNAAAGGPVQVRRAVDAGRLRLVVRDHGPGVPEDVIPHLGQPFYRPDSARTRHAGGVGLGLNRCRAGGAGPRRHAGDPQCAERAGGGGRVAGRGQRLTPSARERSSFGSSGATLDAGRERSSRAPGR